MKIVTIQQMRALEEGAVSRGIPLDRLMENAGLRVAEKAAALLDGKPKGEHVAVLVGPGNNGGDGLVAARHLDDWGARVHVFLCAPRPESDPKLEALRDHVVDISDLAVVQGTGDKSPGEQTGAMAPLAKTLWSARVAIDAVLGASRSRRGIGGSLKAALEQLEAARRRRRDLIVLAVDVPSGLDADTGESDPATPAADVTVTLGFPKAGLFAFPGAAKVGRLEVADIGVPQELADGIDLELSTEAWASSMLPARLLDGHKGTFGSVLIVAGSARYIGAAALACAGAIRAGAGLVTLAAPRSLTPVVAPMVPEATHLPLPESGWGVVQGREAAKLILEELGPYDALLAGCGLGQELGARELVEGLLLGMPAGLAPRTVIDADGLNILSSVPGWWRAVHTDTAVTPHPGEMRRLTGRPLNEFQGDRSGAARSAAAAWGVTVLLKGAYSVTASPDGPMSQGRVLVNPFADPALATAGTGDVLSGIIAGLAAQGLSTADAAALGAYIHGAAGELWRTGGGDSGLAASDLPPLVPRVMKRLRGHGL